MKIERYFCDCCGKEVKNDSDLDLIRVFSEFKAMQDDSYPYDFYNICGDCTNKIQEVIDAKFNEIKNINKINKTVDNKK